MFICLLWGPWRHPLRPLRGEQDQQVLREGGEAGGQEDHTESERLLSNNIVTMSLSGCPAHHADSSHPSLHNPHHGDGERTQLCYIELKKEEKKFIQLPSLEVTISISWDSQFIKTNLQICTLATTHLNLFPYSCLGYPVRLLLSVEATGSGPLSRSCRLEPRLVILISQSSLCLQRKCLVLWTWRARQRLPVTTSPSPLSYDEMSSLVMTAVGQHY